VGSVLRIVITLYFCDVTPGVGIGISGGGGGVVMVSGIRCHRSVVLSPTDIYYQYWSNPNL
jgi:hypothetical protein